MSLVLGETFPVSIPPFWQDLVDRGTVHQATSTSLGSWIESEIAHGRPVIAYAGFDPTAESLHVGSLLPVLGLRRLMQAGVKPIALVGGATGMIGDPSGKSQERVLLDREAVERNVRGIGSQLEQLLQGKVGEDFLLLNNADWFHSINYIDFLRDVGKHFSVNAMMAKDSVRSRLEDREQGISYTEFSYMLLQAYDFLHLFEARGCRLQVGGSDQWGNITAGTDLIRHKHHGADVHGCTFPLLTTASGQKFGKSERGAIWIDPKRTHPYFLYKYFFDAQDADAIKFLKLFTFVSLPEIEAIEKETASHPERREAQRRLAVEVTALIHGREVAESCSGLEHAMHADDLDAFETHAQVLGLLESDQLPTDVDPTTLPVRHRKASELEGEGIGVLELAVEAGLFKSNSEVRREIQSGGGFKINGKAVTDPQARLTRDMLGGRRIVQLRRGKSNKRMMVFG